MLVAQTLEFRKHLANYCLGQYDNELKHGSPHVILFNNFFS